MTAQMQIRRLIGWALLAWFAAATSGFAGTALKSADWLAERLGAPGFVVIDVRPAPAFASSHLAGAVNLPMHDGAWFETRYDVPNLLPPPQILGDQLARHGIGAETAILVLSSARNLATLAEGARAFWSLRAIGHGPVFLLDGGIEAARARGLPLVSDPSGPRAARPYTAHPDWSVLAGANEVEDAMSDGNPPIDARERDAFEGHDVSPLVQESGTIYDAVNLPASALIEAGSGRFLPATSLAARAERVLAATSPWGPGRVVFSDTGIRAALVWFALHEVLGLAPVRLYDGSLAQWTKEDYDMYDSTDGMGGVIGG